MTRRTILGFAPFVIVSAVHLWALAVPTVGITTPTKWLLMPALLVAILVVTIQTRGTSVALLVTAVVLSWAGDVLLGMPGDLGFLIGLGGFFLAHVTYLVLFLTRLKVRRIPRATVLLAVWWIALMVILVPTLGTLVIPVALYGLVLGASATASFACNRWVATGGALFLASDTILALKLFYPGFSIWQQDFIIMVLYLAAQGFIAFGATRGRVPVTAAIKVAA